MRSQSISGARKSGVVGEILGEFGRRRRLEAEIHLHAHRARERFDDFDEPQPAQARHEVFGHSRGEEHVGEVAREAAFDAGPQNLDRDFALAVAVAHPGAMHLGDRSGGHRVAELDVEARQRRLEGGFDLRDGDFARRRRHAVLQPFQLRRDLGSDDVGPGREKLAELDVRGAEPIDRAGEDGEAG